ncbi:MAG: type II toxin-antitoxin system RelE/ParE family toxin [Magnetospirillum sp.]|nr:type II toxin-antitoxin system RelE/ParE family toxin [Magnetospirillum sp.]
MTVPRIRRIRLTAAAATDFANILRWTTAHFGTAQARLYADTISAAVAALAEGPNIPGTKPRPDIGEDVTTLHVARHGRKGRHFLLYRLAPASEVATIEVLRLLHDGMDLQGHVDIDGG